MYIDIQVQYPLFLPDFNGTSNLLDRFFEKSSNINFIKVRPLGAELFHADGQTDTTKLRFSQFCEST